MASISFFWLITCFYGSSAVLMGALNAHYFANKLLSYQIDNINTAVYYQLIHTVMLVLLQFNKEKFAGIPPLLAKYAFCLGILLFSGSIYLLSTQALLPIENIKFIGPLTPIGGLLLILGWLFMILIPLHKKKNIQ